MRNVACIIFAAVFATIGIVRFPKANAVDHFFFFGVAVLFLIMFILGLIKKNKTSDSSESAD